MVVQHNLTAMNSNRMLGLTTASQAKSTEKLSSGYKINRAADDAAGLSISEKMRKQTFLHSSSDHRKENRKRDPNPDQQRTSGNITVLPDNTAFHSRHRLPLPQPQKNRFPTLPIPGLPHCP